MAHVLEVQLPSKTDVNITLGIAFTVLLLIPWKSLTPEAARERPRLIRCLRTKKHVARTAEITSKQMKEMAMIDQAEFSKLG